MGERNVDPSIGFGVTRNTYSADSKFSENTRFDASKPQFSKSEKNVALSFSLKINFWPASPLLRGHLHSDSSHCSEFQLICNGRRRPRGVVAGVCGDIYSFLPPWRVVYGPWSSPDGRVSPEVVYGWAENTNSLETNKSSFLLSAHPMFVTAPVLVAPLVLQSKYNPNPCGARDTRIRGHACAYFSRCRVCVSSTHRCLCVSWYHKNSGSNSFPNCDSTDLETEAGTHWATVRKPVKIQLQILDKVA